MKLTLVLLLVLGLSLCLAQDANNTRKARPLVNKTEGSMTHPHHPRHPPHPRPHHKQNETAPAVEPEAEEAETEQEATNTTDDSAARLLGGKRNAGHQEEKGHKEHKAPGKHLRGHHGKPAAGANVTKPAEPEENNESEEAQVNEEESVVAEQGEDAEEELARLLAADQKARKSKRVAGRRGHKNDRKGNKRNHHQAAKPEEEVGENAEGVIGGEDAEDIEDELRRLLPQIHQGNNNKKPAHAKKGGRPQWKKPSKVKPELKPEDFDFFGEHQIFGEDAFENGEDFGFGWNHHHKKH